MSLLSGLCDLCVERDFFTEIWVVRRGSSAWEHSRPRSMKASCCQPSTTTSPVARPTAERTSSIDQSRTTALG